MSLQVSLSTMPALHSSLPCPMFSGITSIQSRAAIGFRNGPSPSPRKLWVDLYRKIIKKSSIKDKDLERFASHGCLKKISDKFTELFEKVYPCEENPTFDQASSLIDSDLFSEALKKIDWTEEKICCPETKYLKFPKIDAQFYKKIPTAQNSTSNRCLKRVFKTFTELFRKFYPCETEPTLDQASSVIDSDLFLETLKKDNSTREICSEISIDPFASSNENESKIQNSSDNHSHYSLNCYFIAAIVATVSLILGLITILSCIKQRNRIHRTPLQNATLLEIMIPLTVTKQ